MFGLYNRPNYWPFSLYENASNFKLMARKNIKCIFFLITKILLTFRDVNADVTPQDSHVTTATATASWMKVQVQNFLLGFSHYRGKKKKDIITGLEK